MSITWFCDVDAVEKRAKLTIRMENEKRKKLMKGKAGRYHTRPATITRTKGKKGKVNLETSRYE